ncbi:hypothetical protein GCM10029992_30960 [Glycomyces albus]
MRQGSAAPQKTRPMPMPALNSMAYQEVRENSGLESSGPSLIRPSLEMPTPAANRTKPKTTKM